MINSRIHRAAFAPTLAVVVLLLFALAPIPAPLTSPTPPASFDGNDAAALARQIVKIAPSRPPGSAGDLKVAGFVERQFKAIPSGQLSEQTYSGTSNGKGVELRNVILTLPGKSDRTILVVASRDQAAGTGAASSASATAALLELAGNVGATQHQKTLVLASTDGGSEGASGAAELAGQLPGRDRIDAAIVITAPGSPDPRQPFVVSSSDGDVSASAQLVRTAEHAVTDQTSLRPTEDGTLSGLARLALPAGLGEQAVLIARGIDAVGISSAGELPLPASADQRVSPDTLGEFGRSALEVLSAVDASPSPPEHGPGAYVRLGGSLVPGWTLALLALGLLLPAGLAAAFALATAGRAMGARATAWAVSRGAPLAGVALLIWLLALIGLIPRPGFPFDPRRFGIGAGEVAAMLCLLAVAGAIQYELWRRRITSGAPPRTAIAGIGMACVLALCVVWLENPYLALLLVPTGHVWLLAARERPLPPLTVALGAVVSLFPVAAAAAYVAGQAGFGGSTPWSLVLMVGDGQIGLVLAFALSILLGCLVALPVAARGRRVDVSPIARRLPAADENPARKHSPLGAE